MRHSPQDPPSAKPSSSIQNSLRNSPQPARKLGRYDQGLRYRPQAATNWRQQGSRNPRPLDRGLALQGLVHDAPQRPFIPIDEVSTPWRLQERPVADGARLLSPICP